MPGDAPSFEIETPRSPGAVAAIRVKAPADAKPASDTWMADIKIDVVGVGGLSLRDVYGIDQALIARPDPDTLIVMPHGGVAVIDSIARAFSEHGCTERQAARETMGNLPMDERLSHALARASSPLAIDLLLDQPRRWAGRSEEILDESSLADGKILGRLIDPPTVVAVGRPNIGKSSLLNRLGGRSLALAFDRAGTTRDTVGAMIDAAGLVVRWIDTPGLPESGSAGDGLADEASLVRAAIAQADLVVACHDSTGPKLDRLKVSGLESSAVRMLHVTTRVDRAVAEQSPSSEETPPIRTSASSGAGITNLVSSVRESLVPRAVFEDDRPWRFWD